MKIFAAILRDPNPIHWDRNELSRRGFGDRLINQGPANLGYVVEMLAIAFGGYDRILRLTTRFTANVLEGDELVAGGVVTAIDGDVALCDIWLDRSTGERAISGTAQMTIEGRR
jgi:acyl dehydratase